MAVGCVVTEAIASSSGLGCFAVLRPFFPRLALVRVLGHVFSVAGWCCCPALCFSLAFTWTSDYVAPGAEENCIIHIYTPCIVELYHYDRALKSEALKSPSTDREALKNRCKSVSKMVKNGSQSMCCDTYLTLLENPIMCGHGKSLIRDSIA